METNKNIFEKSISFLKGRYFAIIFILLTPTVVGILFDFIKKPIEKNFENSPVIIVWTLISILISVALAFLSLSFKIGLFRYLDSENNQKGIAIKELVKNNWKKIALFALLGITASLVTVVPFILFVIPGLIVGLIIQMAYFFFVIREKGIFDSISLSFHIVKGRVWEFIKKVLYPLVFKIIPHLIVLLVIFGGSIILWTKEVVSVMVLIPVAVILSVYSIYKLVINLIASFVYNYYLFLELEKTAPAITEEELKKSKTKLIVLIVLGAIISIAIFAIMALLLIAFDTYGLQN